MLTKEQVQEIAGAVLDPVLNLPLSEFKAIKNVVVDGDAVAVTVCPGYPVKSVAEELASRVKTALTQAGAASALVTVSGDIIAHRVQRTLKTMAGVKNIIAISSGKGGVGKSTVSANFALALAAEGARVGMLDADIYGPSQPTMLGAKGQPTSRDGVNMDPIESLGLQINSVGFMIDPEEPMIWRGPLVAQALTQLLNQTAWDNLDYLVIDMPPGTGDVQLTLSQSVPVTGAVVVTTPQDIALLDAKKGLRMFEKVSVPVLGIVENMSYVLCPDCGKHINVFGDSHVDETGKKYHLPVLAKMPLNPEFAKEADAGMIETFAGDYLDGAADAVAKLLK